LAEFIETTADGSFATAQDGSDVGDAAVAQFGGFDGGIEAAAGPAHTKWLLQ